MQILVTGGAGYIGSHTVVELINAGFDPIIVDNFSNSSLQVIDHLAEIVGRKVSYVEADCNDYLAMKAIFDIHSFSGVIHFAAYKAVGDSVKDPLSYYDNNLGSLIIVLKLMEKYRVKNFVFSSSCTVYGEPDQVPVTEATPKKKAESPYGNTKAIAEDILEDVYRAKLGIRSLALRYFNPIGAHESAKIGELPNGKPNNLVPFITQTAAGLQDKLVVFGNTYPTPDGTNIRDYIHVVDLAKAHVTALKYLKDKDDNFYDSFNIGTGQGNSTLDIVIKFEKVNSLKLNYEIGPKRAGDIAAIFGNVDKAKQLLGWQAEKAIDQSLRDAWSWQLNLKNRNDNN